MQFWYKSTTLQSTIMIIEKQIKCGQKMNILFVASVWSLRFSLHCRKFHNAVSGTFYYSSSPNDDVMSVIHNNPLRLVLGQRTYYLSLTIIQ